MSHRSKLPSAQISDAGAAGRLVLQGATVPNILTTLGVSPMVYGLDAARPAAGTPDRLYQATDTGALYLDTGSVWLVQRAGAAPDRLGFTSCSDANYLDCGTGSNVGPVGGPGWVIAVNFYWPTLPAADGIMWCYSVAAGTSGWQVAFTSTAVAKVVLLGAAVVIAAFASAPLTTGPHSLALAVSANGLAQSLCIDGGTPAHTTVDVTAFVAPSGSAQHLIGRWPAGGSSMGATQDIAATVAFQHGLAAGALPSDAEMQALTATPSARRLYTPAAYAEAFSLRAALSLPLPAAGGAIVSGGSAPRVATVRGAVTLISR